MNILDSIIVPNERVAHICSAEYRATWKVGDRLIMFGSSRNGKEGVRLILGRVPSHVMTILKIQNGVVLARNDERTEALQLRPISKKYWTYYYGERTAAYVVKIDDLTEEEKLFITTRRIQS